MVFARWDNIRLGPSLRSILSFMRDLIVLIILLIELTNRFFGISKIIIRDIVELVPHTLAHILWVHYESFVRLMGLILVINSTLRGMCEWHLPFILIIVNWV